MFQQFIKDMKVNRGNFLGMLLIIPITFLIGMAVVFGIMHADETADSWFCMGTLISLMFLGLGSLFFGLFYHNEFMVALSMGRTRREFMAAYFARRLLWFLCAYVLLLGCYRLEQAVYAHAFPRYGNEVEFGFLLNWKLAAGVILALTVLNMFIGQLYSRFGKKFLVGLYFVWMALCILGPKMIPDEDHTGATAEFAQSIAAWAVTVPTGMWVVIGICVLAAMLGTSIHFGRKEMVH